MSARDLRKLFKTIAHRQWAEFHIAAVNKIYEPRLEKLIAKRDQRTQGSRLKVIKDTLAIKTIILGLNGGELSAVRKKYPTLKELPPAIRSSRDEHLRS